MAAHSKKPALDSWTEVPGSGPPQANQVLNPSGEPGLSEKYKTQTCPLAGSLNRKIHIPIAFTTFRKSGMRCHSAKRSTFLLHILHMELNKRLLPEENVNLA